MKTCGDCEYCHNSPITCPRYDYYKRIPQEGDPECPPRRRWREAEEKLSRCENYLQELVNANCSCGGSGPGDGCEACEFWHSYKKEAGR